MAAEEQLSGPFLDRYGRIVLARLVDVDVEGHSCLRIWSVSSHLNRARSSGLR